MATESSILAGNLITNKRKAQERRQRLVNELSAWEQQQVAIEGLPPQGGGDLKWWEGRDQRKAYQQQLQAAEVADEGIPTPDYRMWWEGREERADARRRAELGEEALMDWPPEEQAVKERRAAAFRPYWDIRTGLPPQRVGTADFDTLMKQADLDPAAHIRGTQQEQEQHQAIQNAALAVEKRQKAADIARRNGNPSGIWEDGTEPFTRVGTDRASARQAAILNINLPTAPASGQCTTA